jgi:phosphoadenosine phosphosulfate reductase
MISKISLERNEIHLVPLVSLCLFLISIQIIQSSHIVFHSLSLLVQIFLDTLYHFPETLQLAQTASDTYLAPLHTYTPEGCSNPSEFESKYGQELWETDESSYDYLVKVEPAARAYAELGVKAVITGRRKSQGEERGGLKVVEMDERGLIKVNPLIEWSFAQVKEYVDKESVHLVLIIAHP